MYRSIAFYAMDVMRERQREAELHRLAREGRRTGRRGRPEQDGHRRVPRLPFRRP